MALDPNLIDRLTASTDHWDDYMKKLGGIPESMIRETTVIWYFTKEQMLKDKNIYIACYDPPFYKAVGKKSA